MQSAPTQPTHDLLSIDRLCQLFRCTIRRIETAAARDEIVPAWRLNGISYFDADQVERLRELLAN